MAESTELVVIGLGQSLRGDDAVGLEVVQLWQQRHPETAASHRLRVELNQLPGLHLIDLMEGARAAILVDAVHCEDASATILRLTPEEVAAFGDDSPSAHCWGVGETLTLARELKIELPEISILGIRAFNVEMGAGLSPEVQAALPQAVERLQARVLAFLREIRAESSEPGLPLTTT